MALRMALRWVGEERLDTAAEETVARLGLYGTRLKAHSAVEVTDLFCRMLGKE
jgi:hypothetical protein